VRPYGTIGLGLIRSQITGGPNGIVKFTDNELGMNAGAGVMGFVSDHVGVRGDVRYFVLNDNPNCEPATLCRMS
jgi:opacity protein-like surface antigen